MKFEIFAIDDDKTICLLHKYVINLVYEQEPAIYLDARNALEFFAKQKSDFKALIFLDINMPIMNGWAFLKELEKYDYKERYLVIIVTSSVDIFDKKRANKFACVKGYIEKPLTKAKLTSLKANTDFI